MEPIPPLQVYTIRNWDCFYCHSTQKYLSTIFTPEESIGWLFENWGKTRREMPSKNWHVWSLSMLVHYTMWLDWADSDNSLHKCSVPWGFFCTFVLFFLSFVRSFVLAFLDNFLSFVWATSLFSRTSYFPMTFRSSNHINDPFIWSILEIVFSTSPLCYSLKMAKIPIF